MSTWTRYLISAVLAIQTAHAWGSGRPIEELATGAPGHMLNHVLPESNYVSFPTKRLTNAQVLWVNLPLLRELGYDVPDQITPQLEQKIVELLGFTVPPKNAPPGLTTGETKTFYADYYGGKGVGGNLGSARAGIVGNVQIKGIGLTPLSKHSDEVYDGGASLHEGLKEVIWGELLSQEMPFGANRVIAILARGGKLSNQKDPEVLIVREDPIRAGHFSQQIDDGRPKKSDQARMKEVTANLVRALPPSRRTLPPEAELEPNRRRSLGGWLGQTVARMIGREAQTISPEKQAENDIQTQTNRTIALGLVEYVDRIAEQYAAAYARRIYHGATSESNTLLDGGFIDYGTMSAQPAHGPIRFLRHQDPFGSNQELRQRLIKNFSNDILKYLPERISDYLNSLTGGHGLEKYFDHQYGNAVSIELLALTGVPRHLIEKRANPSFGNILGAELLHLSKVGDGKAIDLKGMVQMPDKTAPYNISNILSALGQQSQSASGTLTEMLKVQMGERDPNIGKLVKAYQDFIQEMRSAANVEDVHAKAFDEFVKLSSMNMNRPLSDLYLPELRAAHRTVADNFMGNHDVTAVRNYLGHAIQTNRRIDRSLAPYQTLLSVDRGNLTRVVYDARQDLVMTLDKNGVVVGSPTGQPATIQYCEIMLKTAN